MDGVYTPMAARDLEGAFDGVTSLAADERVVRWSGMFQRGELDALIAETEQDLREPAPHPWASHVWVSAQWALGAFVDAAEPDYPADLRPVLAFEAEAFGHLQRGRIDLLAQMARATLAREQPTYWADYEIAYASCDTYALALCRAVLQRLAAAFPSDFGAVYAVADKGRQAPGETLDWLAATPSIKGAPAEQLVRWALENPTAGPGETLIAAQAWLAHVPRDPNGLRRAAYQFETLKRHDAALDLFQTEDDVYPFRDAPERIARVQAAQLDFDASEATVRGWAARAYPADGREAWAAIATQRVLRHAGEFGRARAHGLAAITAHPDRDQIRLETAVTLRREGFAQDGVDILGPVLTRNPTHFHAAGEMIQSLNAAGRHQEAVSFAADHRIAGGAPNSNILNGWRAALHALERFDEVDAVLEAAQDTLPDATWVFGNIAMSLNAGGMHEKAFDLIRDVTLRDSTSDWRIARIRDYGLAAERLSDARFLLESLAQRYPYRASVWDALIKLKGLDGPIMKQARSKVPTLAFPSVRAAANQFKADPGAWNAAVSLLGRRIKDMRAAGAPDEEIAKAYHERARITDSAFFSDHADDLTHVRTALDDLDTARDLGLDEPTYWQMRTYLLGHGGPSKAHSAASRARALVRPDDLNAQISMLQNNVGQFLSSSNIGMIHVARYAQRRPRDGARLKSFALRQNKWGGSPVVALAALEEAKRWDADVDLDAEIEYAYGALGAHKRYFESKYNSARSISASQRYVDWFENARRNTAKDQATLKSLDLDAMSVTTLTPDGIEEMRQYHPQSGAMIAFRIGAFAGAVDYTDDGHLAGMTIGGERVLDMEHGPLDALGLKREVTRLQVRGHPQLVFAYRADGQMDIQVGDLGVMRVQRDENGETTGVTVEVQDPDTSEFQVSIAVTQAFQEMLQHAQTIRDIQNGKTTSFDMPDAALDALETQFFVAMDNSRSTYAHIAARQLALAQYLGANRANHPIYASEARYNLESIFDGAREDIDPHDVTQPDALALADTAIEAVRQWHALMAATRPDGLAGPTWQTWTAMQDWVRSLQTQDPDLVGAQARLEAQARQNALRAQSNAGWIDETHLSNPGFWRTFTHADVVPKGLNTDDLRLRDVLVRANGDVVVASNVGLSVLRRGYWEWLAFDSRAGRFTPNMDYADIDGASNLTSLTEDAAGRLWIGSRAGLVMLPEGYSAAATMFRPASDQMISGAIDAVVAYDGFVAAGGGAGLSLIDTETLAARIASSDPVAKLRDAGTGVLAIGRTALWLQEGDKRTEILNAQVQDARLGPDGAAIFVLSGKTLQQVPIADVRSGAFTLDRVAGQETIAANDDPFGLAIVDISPDVSALAVLTDLGGSVMQHGGFEQFKQPQSDRPVGITAADERDGRLFMITTEGVAAVVRGEAAYADIGRVHDLLSDPVIATTFIATGTEIMTVDHDAPHADPLRFSGARARVLEQAPDGAIVTHDGQTVLRFARGAVEPQELFAVTQTLPDDLEQAALSDLLAASDGSIWAVAGASVFQWRADVGVTEYSIYLDEATAPFRSDMLFAVHEAPDGRVLVVASNEEHRNHNSQRMHGGLFEFTGTGFRPSTLDVLGSWFLTSATPMGDDTAIVGTAGGFARLTAETLDEFDQSDDASYLALRDRLPALYLGTEGAPLGDDVWLFGSVGGVVALQGNTWFYPDRLNWMLPDHAAANYGSRTVHAIQTDAQGRIYIGTDAGLTVYDPSGAGPESFLISEQRSDFAFGALERDRMSEVNDILLDALPEDSDAKRLTDAFRKTRQKLAELEGQLSTALDAGRPVRDLEKKVIRAQQRDLALLAKLERDEPLVFSMLQLNPLDLRALGRKLPEDVVIAQYLPGKDTLYINLVSRDGAELKEIAVDAAMLERVTQFVTERIARDALGKTRFFEIADSTQTSAEPVAATGLEDVLAGGEDETTQALAWLYDQLLRPIEHSIPQGATLVVSQTGNLAYLPFSALVRNAETATPEYAIERFDIVSAPSLYALDMIIDAGPSVAFSHVVFGDPDGSLANARIEAEVIADILSDDLVELRIGDEATYDELVSYAQDARFIHLATHGKLDHLSPKDSYLLMADNRRMSIPQIMTLPMQDAELVFLSACESGLGRDGLEYRTIAHAFAHAGAPAVIATLWQVDDLAARTLAEAFYEEKMLGSSNAAALGKAQRDMIAAGGPTANPAFWASAVIFGQP